MQRKFIVDGRGKCNIPQILYIMGLLPLLNIWIQFNFFLLLGFVDVVLILPRVIFGLVGELKGSHLLSSCSTT
jgi:hypothetical protein